MRTLSNTFTKKDVLLHVISGAFLFTACLFSSCEGFLKAQDISEQIKKKIEYNNTAPYLIFVDAQKNTGIITKPAGGEVDVKPSDIFNLSFNPDTSYQFIKWQVYDAVTGDEITDNSFLLIDDPQSLDTTCTCQKIPDNPDIELSIRAVTAKRPRIILGKPTSLEPGVPPTTEIQVLFDHFNMDPDNIYYTEEEMQELKETLNLKDSDFLQGDAEHCNNRYYGYNKKGKIVFKNIQIIDYENPSNESMTNYYSAPYWEKEPNIMGGSTLVIPTANPPPPFWATIYVSLDNNFCYYEDGVPVKLIESKAWPYKIHLENDYSVPHIITMLPEGNYNIIKYKDGENGFKELPYNYTKDSEPTNTGIISTGQAAFPTISGDSVTLSFNFKATDEGGNGILNRFRLCCERKPDNSLSQELPVFELPFVHAAANEAYSEFSDEYTYVIPRTEKLKTAGWYCFSVEVMDNFGSASATKFSKYFWIYFSNAASGTYN